MELNNYNFIKCQVNPSNIVEPVKVNEKFLKMKKSKTINNFKEGYKYYSGDNFEIFKNTKCTGIKQIRDNKINYVQNTEEFIWNTKSYIKNLISPQTIFRNKI